MEQARDQMVPLIAVIEDDPDIQQMLQLLLEQKGYRVLAQSEATHAYAMIHEAHPALVILDIWLEAPDSGWWLLSESQRNAQTHSLPVIVSSAHAFMLGEMAALHHEPHYVFLDKPLQPEVLLQTIDTLLDRRRVTV